MTYPITGLEPALFSHLIGLPDAELARHRARRETVTADPSYPDRIALRDADSPYRASHAIFIAEASDTAYDRVGEAPAYLQAHDAARIERA